MVRRNAIGRKALFIVAVVLSLSFFGSAAASATSSPENFSAYLLNHDDRAPRGIRGLSMRQSLATLARSHSYAMARAGRLYHTANLGSKVGGWHYLGENVGVGPDLRVLNKAFMNSPAHRANILCRCYRLVGVGIARDSHGYYWVTHIFFG